MAKALSQLSVTELLSVAALVLDVISGSPADYGMTAAQVTAISDAVTALTNAAASQQSSQATAKAFTVAKEQSQDALELLLRNFRSTAQGHGVNDADMAATGIPQGSPQPTPPSATVPTTDVDTSRRFQHTINWAEATTPDNKKRPKGVMGADIYRKIDGPPPADVNDCTFLTTDSATPYLVEYTADEAGKMAHYMLRWRFRDGGVGSWGETVSATITG